MGIERLILSELLGKDELTRLFDMNKGFNYQKDQCVFKWSPEDD